MQYAASFLSQYAIELAKEEDGGCADDDEQPVGQGQGGDAEHPAAKLDDEQLTYKDEQHDEEELTALRQAVEGAPAHEESLGVEQVPEL